MEQERLERAVDVQRQHILDVITKMPADLLSRPVPLPSGWTPIGLVHHLAVDVERWWFRGAMTGEVDLTSFNGSGWVVPRGMRPADVVSLYREEAAATDDIIARTALDAAPVQWPGQFGPLPFPDLRVLVLHLITETATHAGHLDAARELIDGARWLVLD